MQPTKADKEHLRPLYQRYHDLKAMITTLESAMSGTSESKGRTMSSVSGSSSLSGLQAPSGGRTDDDDEEGGDGRFGNPNPHDTLEHVGLGSDIGEEGTSGGKDSGSAVSSTGDSGSSAGATMAAAGGGKALKDLRTEKRKLQQFLRSYEKEFEEREGRKVRAIGNVSC